MLNPHILFEERQYVGYNIHAFLRRFFIGFFCIAIYFLSDEKDKTAELFIMLGVMTFVISVLLLLVLHLHTMVFDDHIIIEGYWGRRKVKINFNNIVKVEKGRYSKFWLNSPVYNLHLKKAVRFYTYGNTVIKLTDSHGLVYVIGTQKPERLCLIIERRLSDLANPK